MVYYIGTENDVRLIEFDPTHPAFNVAELDEHSQIVKKHFTKPYVHYVGSRSGCGCGFRAQPSCWYDQKSEEFAETVKDHNALADYLEELLRKGETEIEWYGCWSGDEEEEIEFRKVGSSSDIRQDEFEFNEREFLVVKM
jgi:hypothetical protein